MWPLIDGNRCLEGAEANLFRGAVGMMVDQLVLELNQDDGSSSDEANAEFDWIDEMPTTSAPRLYTMWEPGQRLWLLERVATSLLTSRAAPSSSAVYEATIETVYVEIGDLIALEICEGNSISESSWRQSLLDAFVTRCPQDSLLEAMQFEVTAIDPCLPPGLAEKLRVMGHDLGEPDMAASTSSSAPDASRPSDWFAWWAMILDRLVDATYGPRLHHRMDAYLDGDPDQLRRWLQSKGVGHKFYRRIPPLRSRGQTQASIDRLQAIVFAG
ncbi:MAG: hypothetical protein AAGC97_03405 [Planctomycetota bacterium]